MEQITIKAGLNEIAFKNLADGWDIREFLM
jgi:hypothetical protein